MTPVSNRLIRAIKTGQSFLGWDDATYRGVLYRLTGKRSSTTCSIRELEAVKEYMHSQGFPRKAPKGKGRRPNVAKCRKAMLAKIEALLAEGGLSWAYVEGIASHMYRQHVIEWLDDEQLHGVMVALIKQARRKGRSG
ncbi:regulatory protein GemA [Salmonella enterica]|nr:regulatory protein GemA [Salmonella enterica]EDO5382743.1 regulatory protein GemA [Salmonella enterica]EGL4350564.1 regulatory protein GemA [Salmonella enterica]EGL4359886.1 regulatory protein GemA [Salmonella enterica]EGL4382845.1 regulatory protein GemA [Salmonella enterica]